MRKHMLFFVFINVFGNKSWCMEANVPLVPAETKQQGSLKIKIRLPKVVPAQPLAHTSAEILQQSIVVQDASREPVQELRSVLQQEEGVEALQEEEQWFFEDEPLPRYGSWLEDLFASTFGQTSQTSLYLVRFDAPRQRYLSFCEHSRRQLISKYLLYLASDQTTAEYATVHACVQKIPTALIKRQHELYILDCVVQDCGYSESQLSVDQLKVNMFLHDMIYHQKDSAWYQRINGRIRESFEEALRALREGSE